MNLKANEISNSKGGVSVFSLTTPEYCKEYMQGVQLLPANQLSKYKFISVGFSTKHPVKIMRHKKPLQTVEYQTLKQKEQYDYVWQSLNIYEFETFDEGFIIFEQTKLGNVHFHLVVKALASTHDICAEFYDCFNIKRGKPLRHFIKIEDISDAKGLQEYLFSKKEKDYEVLPYEWNKPIKITRKPVINIGKDSQMQLGLIQKDERTIQCIEQLSKKFTIEF